MELTKKDYERLLRQERLKDDPDEKKILYYKWKLSIMPKQVKEINIYFNETEKYLHKVVQEVKEIQCNTFEEYLQNHDLPTIVENRYIFLNNL